MPSYVVLMNFTQQGVEGLKDIPEGIKNAIEQFQGLGGEVKGLYVVMGEYDMVAIVDAPSDETVMAYLLQLSKWGNVRTKTLKAFSVEEFGEWVKSLPEDEE